MFKLLEKKKQPTKKNEKSKVNKSTLKIIPYKKFMENDITKLDVDTYSKTYKFSDINYNLGTFDEKQGYLELYSKVLNSLSDKCENVQITFYNEKINKADFLEQILPKKIHGEEHIQNQLNDVLIEKISNNKHKNLIKRNRFITVTQKDKNFENVKQNFIFHDEDFKNNFATLDSKLEVLNNYDKTNLLSKIYRNSNSQNWQKFRNGEDFKYELMEEKSVIASNYMKFNAKSFETDGKVVTSFMIRDLANYISDQFISDILSINSEMLFTINIKPINSAKAQKLLKSKIDNLKSSKVKKQKKAFQENYSDDVVTTDINEQIIETEEYKKDLSKFDQKLFSVNFLVTLISDEQNIGGVVASFKNVIERSSCTAEIATHQQRELFNSCLPIGRNDVKIKRYVNTNSLTAFVPFDVKSLIDESGFYYGTNLRDEVLMLNRKKLSNLNGFILGSSGAGKSFSGKQDIQNVISYTDDDIIIIDPEREYKYLVEQNIGEVINISNTSKTNINILEIFVEEGSDIDTAIEEKCGYLHSIFNSMIGGKYGLEQEELSLIDMHLSQMYKEYFKDTSKPMPILTDLYNSLKVDDNQDYISLTKSLILKLEMYVNGSLKVFNNQTNVDINNRITCFDIKDLSGKLKKIGQLVIMDYLWDRVMKNFKEGKTTWIFIDEIHLLFKDPETLEGLENAYKRFRKYGALTTGITQNITDLFATKEATTMLSNSEFVKILGQSKFDLDKVINHFGLTKNQADYIKIVEPGKGLIKFGDVIIPYVDKFPKDNFLFEMFDTNPYSEKKKVS